jgi:recombination endonuclease VII
MTRTERDRRYRARNREKVNAWKREWMRKYRIEHPERVRAANGKYNRDKRRLYEHASHKPTRPDPGFCEACGTVDLKRRLFIDHDHLTDKFRGWLCGRCNSALGFAKDSIGTLRLLIAYLEKHGDCSH